MLQSTQHGFYKVPRPRDFSWARTATLCLAKLSARLGDSQAADCRLFGWQDISSSGLATKTLNFFYLRTNNATKWQIKTTVYTNVHFTVDAIMYMYVNNLTGGDSRYTMYTSVKWRGNHVTHSSDHHNSPPCCPSRGGLSGRSPRLFACCPPRLSTQDKICRWWKHRKTKIRTVCTVCMCNNLVMGRFATRTFRSLSLDATRTFRPKMFRPPI